MITWTYGQFRKIFNKAHWTRSRINQDLSIRFLAVQCFTMGIYTGTCHCGICDKFIFVGITKNHKTPTENVTTFIYPRVGYRF